MSKTIIISMSVLLVLSTLGFIAINIYLPSTYTASYKINIQKPSKQIMHYVSDIKSWDKWFIFNSKNSKAEFTNNNMLITTSKNKVITISNIIVEDTKILFTILAQNNEVQGYFDIQEKDSHTHISSSLSGDVTTPVISGVMAIFIKSSLEHILKTSLVNLKILVIGDGK